MFLTCVSNICKLDDLPLLFHAQKSLYNLKLKVLYLITNYHLFYQFWEFGGCVCIKATLSPSFSRTLKSWKTHSNQREPKNNGWVPFKTTLPALWDYNKVCLAVDCQDGNGCNLKTTAIFPSFRGKIASNWLWFVLPLRNTFYFLLLMF